MVEACRDNLHGSLWENQVIASLVFQIPNCTDWPQAIQHEHYKPITPHKMRAIHCEVPLEFLLFRGKKFTSADVQAFGLNLAPESSWACWALDCVAFPVLWKDATQKEVLAVQLLCDNQSPPCGFSGSSLRALFSLLVVLDLAYY